MRKQRTRLEKSLIGPAGEYYVLFQLQMHGMLAALAPANAPSVDILVLNEDETIAAALQVKTRTYGSDGGWHMKKIHETLVRPRLFYVFLDLEPATPAAFIVPSSVVAPLIVASHQAWLRAPGRNGTKRNDTDFRRVLPAYKDPVSAAPPGWLEQYRNRWDALRSTPTPVEQTLSEESR